MSQEGSLNRFLNLRTIKAVLNASDMNRSVRISLIPLCKKEDLSLLIDACSGKKCELLLFAFQQNQSLKNSALLFCPDFPQKIRAKLASLYLFTNA